MDMESMLEVKIQEEESTLHISAPPSPSPPSSPSSPSSPASASPSPSSPIAQSATVDSIADVFPACVCSTGDVLASVETLVDEFQTIDLEDNQKDNGEEVSVQVSDPDYSPEYALAIMESLQEEFQNIDLSDNNKDDSEEIVVAGVSRDYDYSTEDALAIVKTLEDFQTIDVEDNENDNGDEYDDYEEFIIDRDSLIRETDTTKNLYPQRPDAPDCSYYLRTGSCRYGVNCRFNHPGRNENQARRSASPESMQVTKEKEKEDLSEKLGQQECKYYLRAGGCKFGKACRYSHSREKPVGPPPPPAHDFNFLGLPIRLGERECPYYMRTGSCKYGSNCRFHHPDPTAVGGVDIPSGSVSSHPSGASQPASSWSSPPNETVPYLDAANPYVPMMIPPQGVPPNPKWNGYQAPAYPAERSVHPPPALVMNSPTNRPDFSRHNQQHVLDEFPERPGQPECSYFMKTGDCKYRSACKFNHPKNRAPKSSAQLSPMGLPLRPDQSICTHYHRYGICKFGPACKFDHPVNYAF